MAPPMDAGSPWWITSGQKLQQPNMLGDLSFKGECAPAEGFQITKQMGFHFQEKESTSTQSTSQSYSDAASVETNKFGKNSLSVRSGLYGLHEEEQSKSTVSFQDYVFPHQPIDYKQSAFFPHNDPYGHGLVTPYGPFPGVHAQILGTRVPLPFNPQQNEPIYVNAKQYKAILRRRESRAKLDAQNKLPKARKPYLHESRHRHAINRARGTGGRFMNAKKPHDSKANTESGGTELDIPGSMQVKLNVKGMNCDFHELDSKNENTMMVNCTDIKRESSNSFHPQEKALHA